MRIALIGTKMYPCTKVARYMSKKHSFKLMAMQDGVEKIYRTLFYNEKWKHIPWEKSVKLYDAIYSVDPNAWVHYMEKKLSTTTRSVVVPDVRYVNELDALRALGFIIIRVKLIDNIKPSPAKSLLDAGEGTIIVNEYYGKLNVDYAVTFETLQGMKESVDYMVNGLMERFA